MTTELTQADMQSILDRQKKAYLAEGVVSVETRLDRIARRTSPRWLISTVLLVRCSTPRNT